MQRFPETVKSALMGIVSDMAKDTSPYVRNPTADFTRDRKLNFENTVSLILSMGGQPINSELLDYFQYVAPEIPTASALVQRRDKILPAAFAHIFHRFNGIFQAGASCDGFRLLAADGSDINFNSDAPAEEYCLDPGCPGSRGCSVHLTAMYELGNRLYTDAVIQPCHAKDEFRAFCDMVDRYPDADAPRTIWMADRGFSSFNVFAHVIEKGGFFLIRGKDVTSKGLAGRLPLPKSGEFDITLAIQLVRRQARSLKNLPGVTKFIGKKVSFDFLDYGADGAYTMTLRFVRFQLPGGGYECIITNLPAGQFPPEKIRELYNRRWGLETAFRELKYSIGMASFHSKKPDFILQEIWARLVLYNFCEVITTHVVVEQKETKYVYQLNYTMAIRICHKFLKILPSAYQPDVEALISKYLLPVREGRHYKRNVKHGTVVSFLYRIA